MPAADQREITVLGAGVAGLAVALACARRGMAVTVLERAEEIREVGAGLQISPNGVRVLRGLGLSPADAGEALRSTGVVLRRDDGTRLARLALPPDPGTWLMHRADLVYLLAQAARAAGVQIRLLHYVDGVEIAGDGAVQVRLGTGGLLRPDLLIAADGLHSVTRRAVLGARAAKATFTGQVAWRALVPGRAGDPVEASLYMGPGRHLVSYPLRGGAWRNIVAVEERKTWTEESWTNADDPTRMQRAFSGFAPEVRGWLSEAREVFLWGLFRHDVPDQWYRGRAVMMGDAVHPTLPFLAQGANMALEDAWVLAEALARHPDPAEAFAAYQATRIKRVRALVAEANRNAWVYHLPAGLTRSVVHSVLKLGDRFAPDRALRRFDWVYNEDVTQG